MMCRNLLSISLLAVALAVANVALAQNRDRQAGQAKTCLIIEGGGLLPNNKAVYERLVVSAKLQGRTRIGYFPTASSDPERAQIGIQRFINRLGPYGVPPANIEIFDITVANAAVQADNPVVVAKIRECTAIFFGGGDQTNITRALQPGGKPTLALKAIYDLRESGGLIAGTSAGAAVQSKTMITVSGLPGDQLDEGLDALDFGLTKAFDEPYRRGLLISPGLAFLESGIIDQHFSQYRGRLGRLARAAIEQNVRFGFGIDENTALAVATDGTLEVLGAGAVTIVDTQGATCQDGPLGCTITGVHLSCLEQGDRFDPILGEATIHPGKPQILAGKEGIKGNFQIPDIAARGAVPRALISGLGNNSSRKQIGITLKHNRHYGHGYRFTFTKTDQTRAYEGTVEGLGSEAVTHVRLDIEPVALTLRHPKSALPPDVLEMPAGPSRTALEAIAFRGIMLADDQGRFRPSDSITRAELASAIALTIRLEPTWSVPPKFTDLPAESPEGEEIALVVAAGIMEAPGGVFRPADPISRQEAADALVRLTEKYRSKVLPAVPFVFDDAQAIGEQHEKAVLAAHGAKLMRSTAKKIRPGADLTRAEAAAAIYEVLSFPWKEDKPK